MRFVERLATYLDVLGIPTGNLCPHIFVAEVCGHFVTADTLTASGAVIPGRRWSSDDLRAAAKAYIGIDVVPEVLRNEMRPGLTVEQYWTQYAGRLLEQEKDDPERFANAIHEISSRILEAQQRLSR